MADDRELFGDLGDFDDLGGLDEAPSFGLVEDEDIEFAPPQEEGISRTFKIVGALIGLGVVVIVILLVLFALGGDELSGNEKTSTAVAIFNASEIAKFDSTATALQLMANATQTKIAQDIQTATADFFVLQTVESQRATDRANTATAEFQAEQTMAALQTATQEAINAGLTATATANWLAGKLVDAQGNVFGNVSVRLYRDNGDGQFTPEDRTPAPGAEPTEEAAAPGGSTVTGEAKPINYGEIGNGTVARGEVAEWTFTGQRGDSVIINAIASDPVQMDMFIELFGPDGSKLAGDDDSGEESNAAITGLTLPADGKYTIQVSSVAGPGSYTLLLSLGLTIPAPQTPEPTGALIPDATLPTEPEGPPAEPTQETDSSAYQAPSDGIVLASAGGSSGEPGAFAQDSTPTPEPTGVPPVPTATPALPSIDELINVITTGTDGSIDFGSLEPGDYWIEIEYDSLTPELQALVPAGQPLVIFVQIPSAGGIPTFDFSQTPTPSPTPTEPGAVGPSAFEQTATALFSQRTGTPGQIVTLTPTPEVEGTIVPGATMPGTGIFSDIGDKGGDMSGTSGLTVLAIAAAGLIAVVFIARKLRTS